MSIALHNDIARLFPELEDHIVLEILEIKPTIDELEAAQLLLRDDNEDLIDIKQREGGRINQLVRILSASVIAPEEDID